VVQEQVQIEQGVVDRVYARLDEVRDGYRRSLRQVNATQGVGTGQGDRERDVIAAHFGELIHRLGLVEDRLVFGRLDPREGSLRYIGRIGIADQDGAPLLIDWRAPAGRPFYQATAAHPEGMARRRHIATRNRRVTGLEDEVLDQASARQQGLELQGEGALLSALSQARAGRMTDIVPTIQAEQDRVIRASDAGLLVVEGGPGTGKTAVALHRAAYLLYTERDRLERSGVLVVGPSRVFLRYIEEVLPSLGESGVVATTIGDLVPGVHARAVDAEDVDRAKGDPAWAGVLAAAVRDLERVPSADQVLDIAGHAVTLTVGDVTAAQARARRGGRPHNVARDSFALGLVDLLATRLLVDAQDTSDPDIDPDELALWREEVRDSVDARRAINLAWMPMSGTQLLERLYARPDLLARLNASVSPRLSRDQLALVARAKGSALTVSDIALVDESEELLGTSTVVSAADAADRARELSRAQSTLDDLQLEDNPVTAEFLAASFETGHDVTPLAERAAADRTWTYGHIIVDEAQELSPMAWRALLRRCPSLSFTVVGDLDQRRGHQRPRTWREALGPAARALAEEQVLSISYRTPATLITLAQQVMADLGDPVRHPVRAVRDVADAYALTRVPAAAAAPSSRDADPLWDHVQRVVAEEIARLDRTAGPGLGRLAVVLGSPRARAWDADLVGYSGLDRRVSLLSAVSVKGLEFDVVVLVEPAEILTDGAGDLFVAMTRSTQRLHVVAAGALPVAMGRSPAERGRTPTPTSDTMTP